MAFINYISLFSTLIIFCFQYLNFSTAIDTINSSHYIKDPETITSNDGAFTLGFYSPENSANRYVGIWYMSKSTVIWVANRDQPLKDSSGSFTISNDGNLVVLNGQKHVMWSSNVSSISTNSSSKLSDSGKLDLLDSKGNKVWESFQHPTDTLMPNMRLSNNERTGEKVEITAWKSPSDPSRGNFTTTIERETFPEIFIRNEETHPYWRSGPWNGIVFTGIPDMLSYYLNGFSLNVLEDGTFYVSYVYVNKSLSTLFALNWEGKLQQKIWDYEEKEWQVEWEAQVSECDVYGKCGAFGICYSERSPICNCLEGFEPSNREEWNRQNWTNGCVRRKSLQCGNPNQNGSEADGFLNLQNVKVPDFAERSLDSSKEMCRSQCLANCTCVAYSYDSQMGCMTWSGNIIDTQKFSSEGIDLGIRVASSELDRGRTNKAIITISVIAGLVILVISAYFLWKNFARKRKRKGLLPFNRGEASAENISGSLTGVGDRSQVELQDSLLFDTETLVIATNNFHFSNKLGQGGFGPVYKGKLKDGKEIAVKKLSSVSGQGLVEFTNEVTLISKLQHRNLVRLLGCCREYEKMLIYEFMPNTSLDSFIFDPPENKFLNWRKRFNIIEGIARGLLYLHRDSRLRIIHRDLKASNILLDEELNPKISDFGLARIFGGHEDHANTKRVVGTYGYMSPEYAMQGLFSEKSDVFSFGVLLLEIVSGKRNSSFNKNEESVSLLGFAWKLWNDNNFVPLLDEGMHGSDHEKDILRCVHIGLLCVQESARDRPAMAVVISMLNSEIINLPQPKQPAFIIKETILPLSSEEHHGSFSNNSVSVTEIQGR
ncbi:G-type lectin S-receptor-like serine/threonine-protein kinase At1g11300 isoform X1 [Lotus japonicus]|uniref:G-type lectin S-receptor-like serine/threonine-protein kinase At1g11300 isoform X1 n=1 Tax=Lotus japonicus TaxID=34305 RepID=UPI0025841635|nr:G-type lectin S-receptor-like serine/threonine-protein kinase At1g11300 isoform X1 [Lotus japonicus]